MLCAGSLAGQRISIDGLSTSGTDVLLRYWPRSEESARTVLLKPDSASTQLAADESAGRGIAAYLNLGIQHILTGIDHLLFVLALIFIVQGGWMLLKTITAFTLAHSLTLVAASIGVVKLPSSFVEAMIALSIMFLGLEILRRLWGQTSFTIQFPWAVAFAFGLLHGLAFASELADFGLPLGELMMAVLLFNAGVEIGQILFIAVVLVVWVSLSKFRDDWPRWVKPFPGYAIGIAGAFWFVERTMALIFNGAGYT
jgi:hydrogenase/urease accessory protein HupE